MDNLLGELPVIRLAGARHHVYSEGRGLWQVKPYIVFFGCVPLDDGALSLLSDLVFGTSALVTGPSTAR